MKLINNFHTVEENLKRQRMLIEPFLKQFDLSNPRRRRKFQELNQTAIFLIFYSHAWQLSEIRDKPDFIIENGQSSVGLEHTRIINEDLKRREGDVEDLFIRAENQLISESINSKFLANIYIKGDYLVRSSQKANDIKEICEVVKRFTQDGSLLESDIIERISIMPHDRIALMPNLGAWWQAPITIEQIHSAINEKERLIETYQANTNLKQWLLLVIGDTGESSYALLNNLEPQINSPFEKIFLLEISALKLFEVK